MALGDRVVCVEPISKNLTGALDLVESALERCEKLECESLETYHRFRFEVGGHDCDSEIGRLLDGLLHGTLVHKFAEGKGTMRGVHEGSWRLRGAVLAAGRLRGITNAGTHREPAFEPCQKCHHPGVMEGILYGKVRRADTSRFVGCEIRAAYRIAFEADEQGGGGDARGTLEGGLLCPCPE
ncbi:MAG TPA: hypothetical protein VGW75_07825 [Solirubrobacteraceae bacterium]|jgi:hypothetical protein|nr:hypothetical protein [Solirubrobacteraceae bacterium]